MVNKIEYNTWTGFIKTAKNSAFLLIPFAIAVLSGVPQEYAWLAGPIVYMLKNYVENK